jgi:hypothetical protein
MLVGYGVGKEGASATSATLSWFMRDGLGMFGGMLFAWSQAQQFGLDVRKWRLFADVINDVGLTLELVSPLCPGYFLLFATLGSVCRSMCGVAAGATRSALSLHFARKKNLADISAKEGIQETCVTLLGLVLGMWVATVVDGDLTLTWLIFVTLTFVHVYANWKGMKALVLASVDRQRAALLTQHFLEHHDVLTPVQIASRESILWRDRASPSIELGVSLARLMEGGLSDFHDCLSWSGSARQYLIGVSPDCTRIIVALRTGCPEGTLIEAYFHSACARRVMMSFRRNSDGPRNRRDDMMAALKQHEKSYVHFLAGLEECGWDLEQGYQLGQGPYRSDWCRDGDGNSDGQGLEEPTSSAYSPPPFVEPVLRHRHLTRSAGKIVRSIHKDYTGQGD